MFLARIAAIPGFLFGFDTAVIHGVLLFLRRPFALDNFQLEIAASSLPPRVVTFTFLSPVKIPGISGTFAVYAFVCMVGFAYTWKCVAETRGKTLEQIQQEWRD